MSLMIDKFKKAVPVLEKIEQAGFEAYFVGGSVRDFLLNRTIDDVDIATSAFPEEVKQIFPKTIDVGIKHGTVVVIYKGENYEITTFRTEGEYTDFRRPREVTFIRTLEEDLKRRDFTMNAIAMDKTGMLIDPFSGRMAIKHKIIKTVGEADERFREDALRIMRAVRFISQLSFQIEQETSIAIKKNGHLLSYISIERIYAEFKKIIMGKNRQAAIYYLVEGDLHHFLPKLKSYGKELKQTAQLMSTMMWSESEFWAILLILIKVESVESFLRAWKTPIKTIKTVKQIVKAYELRSKEDWNEENIYYTGIEICESAEKIYAMINDLPLSDYFKAIRDMYENLPIKCRTELVVSGNDLMEWTSRESGPWIKEMIENIEKAVIHKEVANEKDKIKEWLFS